MYPNLAFSGYMITHPYKFIVVNEISMVFTAESQYNQFMNIFNKVLCRNEDNFLFLWDKSGDIGSHLAWNSSATLAVSG